MKKALVCGAGGFIGHHLVKVLKKEGYYVRGVDAKKPNLSESEADEFLQLDLTNPVNCQKALSGSIDEIYQMAAYVGGIGLIAEGKTRIIRDNSLINIHMLTEASKKNVKRFFFPSSVLVYKNTNNSEKRISEEDAYPANPSSEYGWEKLYTEKLCMAFQKNEGMEIRIGRLQNAYGPECEWEGGRERAVAALCRKVILADNKGFVEVWGDGRAKRGYTYINDLIEGILLLTHSNIKSPVNIGSDNYISINELIEMIIKISGKDLSVKHVKGPIGAKNRRYSKEKLYSLGWKEKTKIEQGVKKTYDWIANQIKKKLKTQTN